MRRVPVILIVLALLFLIVSFFIPVKLENKIFVANTFENIASSTIRPKSWIKWDASVREAWEKDSSACHFTEDSVQHTATVEIPGKKIIITQVSYLIYQLEEIKDHGPSSAFGFGIVPYVGNGQQRSEHNTNLVYARYTNLFYKLFPFLEKPSFAKRTISGLTAFVEDNLRFYGYAIDLKQSNDTLFLTKSEDLAKKDLFPRIPVLFEEIGREARNNNCKTGIKNLSYAMLGGDSLTVMAGYNIDKIIKGDYLYIFKQFPAGQPLAVGTYKGIYRDRFRLYAAMDKYIPDHQLLKVGLPFEKYAAAAPLPVSDSSVVAFELCYPLRFQ
jgi:hypothetical protein